MYHELVLLLRSERDEEQSKKMASYMKNHFPFIGLRAAKRRELSKEFVRTFPFDEEADQVIHSLWNEEEREFQYVALDFLIRHKRKLTLDHMDLIEYIIKSKQWWDTIDLIANHLVGELFAKHPELRKVYIPKWIESEDIWQMRTALLFQLKYKDNMDQILLFKTIEQIKYHQDFFIQKAIGWILREYSKTNPAEVIRFIKKTELSNLAVREGSKYI